jgi:N-acyl-D-aspartate/D-glutamate deacylase
MGVNVRDSNGGREIVVTPGFVKVTDDDAKVLDRPQVMVQQVLHGI